MNEHAQEGSLTPQLEGAARSAAHPVRQRQGAESPQSKKEGEKDE